jgi:hypothetical protein
MKANIKIRKQILSTGAKMSEIAEIMQIHQSTLSHLLQTPLSDKNEQRIKEAIAQVEKGFEHEQKETKV